MMDKVNLVKSVLNKELESRDLNDEVILIISQELDRIIVDYYKSITGDKEYINEMQD